MARNPTPNPSGLTGDQVLQRAFDQANDELRVGISNVTIDSGSMEVSISDISDSIKIGNGSGSLFATLTIVGGDIGLDVNVLNIIPVSQSGNWDIRNIIGTVSLPTGASTSALQTTGNTSLSSIDSKIDVSLSTRASESTLSALNAKFNSLGQKAMAASAPVVIASDQSAIPASQSGTWNINNISGPVSLPTGASTLAAQNTGNSSLSSIDGKLADNYGASTGAIRTAAQVGNTTGAADFNAGATGAQTLRVASNLYDGSANALSSKSYDAVRALDVYNVQIGASTATHTLITLSANVSTQLAAANSARKWIYIINNSGANIFIKYGTTAVINQGFRLNNSNTMTISATELFLGAINAIVGSNNRTVEIVEGS